jgi:hypothetical protein
MLLAVPATGDPLALGETSTVNVAVVVTGMDD